MKKFIFAFSAIILFVEMILFQNLVFAQHYTLTPKGSKLEFSSKLTGAEQFKTGFGNISGKIIFNPDNLKDAAMDILIKTNSLHTGLSKTDNALKSCNYFCVSKFPEIQIKSESISKNIPNGIVYQMHGVLTIRGITQKVIIPFTATPNGSGYLFRGSFSISPFTFDIGLNETKEDKIIFFVELRANKVD